MKGEDNMGKSGSKNTGDLKYKGQGSVGKRTTSNTPAMPRATCDERKGVRPSSSHTVHNSKDY